MIEKIQRISDQINTYVEWVSLTILSVLTVLTFSGIIARYVFGNPIVWLYETTLVLFSWMIFLGVSIAFKYRDHIQLELIYHYLSSTTVRRLRIFVEICVMIFLLILVKDGIEVVTNTATQRYNTINLSTAWFYFPLPFCGLLSLLHMLAEYLTERKAKTDREK